MREPISRRSVLHAAAGVTIAGAFAPASFASATWSEPAPSPVPLDPEMVRSFVGMAHRAKDIEQFAAILDEEPALINATVDWLSGDFETALGAAAHVGNTEGMRLLLDRGARLDLFAAASLGYLDVIKAAIIADRRVAHTMGPHGIALITHARTNEREAVVDYLRSIGADDTPGSLTPDRLPRYVGEFRGDAGACDVVVDGNGLALRGDHAGRLTHTGAHNFRLKPSSGDDLDVQFRMTPIRPYAIRMKRAGAQDEWKQSFVIR